jgi:hypothetical protein
MSEVGATLAQLKAELHGKRAKESSYRGDARSGE